MINKALHWALFDTTIHVVLVHVYNPSSASKNLYVPDSRMKTDFQKLADNCCFIQSVCHLDLEGTTIYTIGPYSESLF